MSEGHKTQPATARRLLRARQQGDSPISRVATAAGAWLAMGGAVAALASQSFSKIKHWLLLALQGESTALEQPSVLSAFGQVALPLLASAAVGALTVGLLQTRGHLSFALFGDNSARSRKISGNGLQRLRAQVGGGLLFGLFSAAALASLRNSGQDLANLVGKPENLGLWFEQHGTPLLWIALGTGVLASASGWGATYFRWLQRHRMTSQEVAAEEREGEADPSLKQLRRANHQQALRETEIERLVQAQLLVVGRAWVTTALGYREAQNSAPFVLLQGAGAMGRLIQTQAQVLNVPLLHDARLSQRLSALGPDEVIPEACFRPVAEAMGRKLTSQQ